MKLKYPPLLQALVSIAVALLVSRYLPQFAMNIPFAIIIAAVLIVSGIAVTAKAVGTFSSHKTTINPIDPAQASTLVIDGLYRFTRNPMYLGMLLVVVGTVVASQNIISIAAIFLYMATMTQFQIKPEERIMHEKFGQAYMDYKSRVRRWI